MSMITIIVSSNTGFFCFAMALERESRCRGAFSCRDGRGDTVDAESSIRYLLPPLAPGLTLSLNRFLIFCTGAVGLILMI